MTRTGIRNISPGMLAVVNPPSPSAQFMMSNRSPHGDHTLGDITHLMVKPYKARKGSKFKHNHLDLASLDTPIEAPEYMGHPPEEVLKS